MKKEQQEKYMRQAINLARRGRGRTLPNPMVGAVIVKDDRVIGEGFHEEFGGLHAERNALANVTESPEGADMFVTLEPCAHHGKTPPCTEAIIESGIKRVFTGSEDPNPKVNGRGISCLEAAGIEVVKGVLKAECDSLNRIFFHYISTKRPYLMMKYAMTADGKIAAHTGDSKWISSEESRELVQSMRNEYPAIMAGIGTVLKDDPGLTCRLENGTDPVRIICDSSLKIPRDSNIIRTASVIPTFIVCAVPGMENGILSKAHLKGVDKGNYLNRYGACVSYGGEEYVHGIIEPMDKAAGLISCGAGIINVCGDDGRTDLRHLMQILGGCGIAGVMLEGGGELNFSALKTGIVNEVNAFIGAKMVGGEAKTPVMGEGVSVIRDAYPLKLSGISAVGEDVLINYTVQALNP